MTGLHLRTNTRLRRFAVPLVLLALAALPGCAGKGLVASIAIAELPEGSSLLSLNSVLGATDEVASRFRAVLADEARIRGFIIAPPGSTGPGTQITTHFDQYRTQDGKTVIAWVISSSLDGKTRIGRSSGAVPVTSRDSMPWSGLDQATMRQIAARGLDDLRQILANGTAGPITPPGESET